MLSMNPMSHPEDLGAESFNAPSYGARSTSFTPNSVTGGANSPPWTISTGPADPRPIVVATHRLAKHFNLRDGKCKAMMPPLRHLDYRRVRNRSYNPDLINQQ